jgi:hypothetical protein
MQPPDLNGSAFRKMLNAELGELAAGGGYGTADSSVRPLTRIECVGRSGFACSAYQGRRSAPRQLVVKSGEVANSRDGRSIRRESLVVNVGLAVSTIAREPIKQAFAARPIFDLVPAPSHGRGWEFESPAPQPVF